MSSNISGTLVLLGAVALFWTGIQNPHFRAVLAAESPNLAAQPDKDSSSHGLRLPSAQKAAALKSSPTPIRTATPKPTPLRAAKPTPKPTLKPKPLPTPISIATISPTLIPTSTSSATTGELAGSDRCPGADDLSQPKTATLCLLNYARKYHRLGSVATFDVLMASSLQKAKDVAACGYNHNPCNRANPLPSGVGCVGEVLFQGINTPRDAMSGWLRSAGHRAILLDGDFRDFGFATLGDNGGRVWVGQLAGC